MHAVYRIALRAWCALQDPPVPLERWVSGAEAIPPGWVALLEQAGVPRSSWPRHEVPALAQRVQDPEGMDVIHPDRRQGGRPPLDTLLDRALAARGSSRFAWCSDHMISPSTVANYCSGRRCMPAQLAQDIERDLGVPAAEWGRVRQRWTVENGHSNAPVSKRAK